MHSIESVAEEVKRLADRLQAEGLALQVRAENDLDIIKIYLEGSDAVKRAIAGIHDVSELAYTTAEHHPYWGIIYHAAEISKIPLEKWNYDLSKDELDEIEWRVKEIRGVLERLKQTRGVSS